MGKILGTGGRPKVNDMQYVCDIVLLSYESPELLKKCIESILEHTRVKSRLIIVDNASRNPEVTRYLHEIHGNKNVTIEKIFSEENVGFARGMNKGMKLSEAPFVCLLNNDCVVTDGWLEEMIAATTKRDDIGLVNPQSNTFGSKPDKGVSIDDHATLIKDKKGRFVELGHIIAFACLVKREVIERIGCFDEEYEGVCYEDTDFSIRAQKAGFISVMAEGAYVFHAEQASRKTLKDKENIYARNREICEGRWGRLLRVFFFEQNAAEDDRYVFEKYESLKNIARKRAIIEMWVRQNRSIEEIYDGLSDRNIIRHADIGINTCSKKFMMLHILWRVLTKKKKYDAVIIRNGVLLRFLRFLKLLHQAEVFSLEDGMRLRSANGIQFDFKDSSGFAEYLRG